LCSIRAARAVAMPSSVSRRTGAEILEAHAFFKMLGTDLLLKLADYAKCIRGDSGSILCQQGDQPDKCYIVMSGTVGVFIDKNCIRRTIKRTMRRRASKPIPGAEDSLKLSSLSHGEQVTTLGPGRLFGELALINSEPRAATVKCLVDCEFLTIDKSHFKNVIKKNDFLKGIRFFQDFAPHVVAEVAKVAQFQTYLAKEFVFLQGHSPGSCYIVILGQVDIYVDKDGGPLAQNTPADSLWQRQTSAPEAPLGMPSKKSSQSRDGRRNSHAASFGNVGDCVVSLGPGSLFGELALLNDKPRAASVKCQSDCTFLVLSRDQFEKVLMEEMSRLGDDKTKFLLKHLPGFARLAYPRPDSSAKPPLSYFFKKVEFPRGHVFVSQGMHESKGKAGMFVILQGSADFFHVIDGKIQDLARRKCTDMLRSQRPTTFTHLPKLRSGSHLCGLPGINHAGTLTVGGVYAVLPNKGQVEPFTLVASSSPCIVWQIDGADLDQLPKNFVAQVQKFVADANMWRLSSYQSIYSRRIFEQFIGTSDQGKPRRQALNVPVPKKPPGTGPSKAVAPLSRAMSAPGCRGSVSRAQTAPGSLRGSVRN